MVLPTESDPLLDLRPIFDAFHEFKTRLISRINWIGVKEISEILLLNGSNSFFSYNSFLFQNYPRFSYRERMGSSTESDPLPFDLLSIFVVSHEFKTQLLISIRFLKFASVEATLFSYNLFLLYTLLNEINKLYKNIIFKKNILSN